MRIQTRLFLGTAALVLALMAAQWWLYARQIQAIEREISLVATTVGASILSGPLHVFLAAAGMEDCEPPGAMWVTDELQTAAGVLTQAGGSGRQGITEVEVIVLSDEDDEASRRVIRRTLTRQLTASGGVDQTMEGVDDTEILVQAYSTAGTVVQHPPPGDHPVPGGARHEVHRIELKVEPGEGRRERFLVIKSRPDLEAARIPIPVSPTVEAFEGVLRQGLAVGAGLLCVGLVAAGVLSQRVTRPLRHLADRAEAIGQGALGVQVEGGAGGEIGELQRAFNQMSQRLAELESEKEAWRQREHLAQLGDLARGLAHTLRNPLNTLGLSVEELASRSGGDPALVTTARAQIRRIDRWLRSFLAVSVGHGALAEDCDLGALVQEVVLEGIQQGAQISLVVGEELPPVRAVRGAVRAALANLLENAIQAAPASQPIDVGVGQEGAGVFVTIRDRGPGVPEEVRERLFSPHVTTRTEGAGMGLYLARQLIVGMHSGTLRLEHAPDGGTVARVELPVATEPEAIGDGV